MKNVLHWKINLKIKFTSKLKLHNPLHKYKFHEFFFVNIFEKREKLVKGKIMKLLGSRWFLVNRCDGKMCKSYFNQLRRNRDISYEIFDRVKERDHSYNPISHKLKIWEIVVKNNND